jgi:hypothetical protein
MLCLRGTATRIDTGRADDGGEILMVRDNPAVDYALTGVSIACVAGIVIIHRANRKLRPRGRMIRLLYGR